MDSCPPFSQEAKTSPPYALVPVFRDEQLRAAPVVEHQCHAFELEPIQELDQQPYLAPSDRSAPGFIGRR